MPACRRAVRGVQVATVSIPQRIFLVFGVAVLVLAIGLIVAMLIDVGTGSGGDSRSVTGVTFSE